MRTKLPEPVPVVSAALVDAKWRLPDGKTSKTQGSSHWNRSLELEHTNISPFSARNVLAGNPTLHVMPPRAINSPVYGFIRHHVLSQTSRQFITTSLCDLNNIPIRIIKWLFTFLNTWFFYTMPSTRKAPTNADWFLMSHFLSFVETTTNSLRAFFVMPAVRFPQTLPQLTNAGYGGKLAV